MPTPPTLTAEQRKAAADKAAQTRAMKKLNVDPAEITFGIEIECYIPDASIHEFEINVGSYHMGRSLPSAYFPAGWKAESDGSLNNVPAGGFTAVEIISPVLRGIDGIEQVLRVVELLGKSRMDGGLGAKVNRTCGQHVHIGMPSVLGDKANDLEAVSEWVRKLLHLIAHHEPALYAVTGFKSRIHNSYCETVKELWAGKAGKHLSYGTLRNTGGSRGDDSRRVTLNVKNLFSSKKTVEFRVFGGTLTPKKSIGYIFTALGMAHKAAASASVIEWDEERTRKTIDPDYYTAAVKHMHDRLAWYDAPARPKWGWMAGAWERWGALVKENQLWNARHIAESEE